MRCFSKCGCTGILSLFLGLFFISNAFSQNRYTVSTVPNPKQQGQDFYVSNPDRVLSPHTVQQLNGFSADIDKTSGAEYAVVVVNDFEGDDVFEFALQLFNTWGIGKKEQNNGLLLFVAKNRREFRFISGYGMEAIFPDAYLHRIGQKHLVPRFRAGNYDGGVLEASRAIQQALTSPDVQAELHRMMPEATPFFSLRNAHLKNTVLVILLYTGMYYWVGISRHKWQRRNNRRRKKNKGGCSGAAAYGLLGGLATLFTLLAVMLIFTFLLDDVGRLFRLSALPYVFALWGSYTLALKISEERDIVKKSFRDEENKLKALQGFQTYTFIPYVFSPFMLFGFFKFVKSRQASKGRFIPPDDSGNWERVNRDAVPRKKMANYLNTGQLKEEKLNTKFHEVWLNKKTGEQKTLSWEGTHLHAICPSCGFKTYVQNKEKTLKRATYSNTGLKQLYNECAYCRHKEDVGTEVIPVKIRNSGGGSSGGGGFSGGSSGGGGSFGGGSSGGGGAGGRW